MRTDRAQREATALQRLELLDQELAPVLGVEAAPLPHPGRHARNPGLGLARLIPASLISKPVALGRPHALWVAALLALALVLTLWVFAGQRAQAEPVKAVALPQASPGVPVAAPTAGVSPGAGAGAVGESVIVDVAGRVRHPGLVSLPAGSRVFDALKKAGGARRGVNLTSINLARVLVDGEQIVVGNGSAATEVGAAAPSSAGLVNLNTAGLSELDTLPGVGPVTAQRILEWRTSNGGFHAIDELLEVPGIGDKTLADISPHVTL